MTFFSYYGSKSKIIKYYPSPLYDTIIEPFAGSAAYSLYQKNWEKNVILIEKDKIIYDLWIYLQNANPKDILKLPSMKYKDDIRNFKQLCLEEKYLMGFWANRGSSRPKNIVMKWASKEGYWDRKKKEISENLYKIKHWQIINSDYTKFINIEATWFIDPPYQYTGKYYTYSNKDINYNQLANWCKNRNGQVIVCENTSANWLDFIPLVSITGQLHKTIEVIYYKEQSKKYNDYLKESIRK